MTEEQTKPEVEEADFEAPEQPEQPEPTDEIVAEEQPVDPGPQRQLVPHKKPALVANDKGYIAPTTVEEAMRMANAVIAGRLAPSSYKDDPAKIMLGIMSALEAGLPPLYGLRQIAIINGRPTIWGDGAIALVQSKNLISNQTSAKIGTAPTTTKLQDWPDDFGYEVKIWRRNQIDPYVGIFTVGMAKRANLWLNAKKVPWMEHPERMLFNRARAFALRDGFADALGGIAIREEIEDTFDVDDEKHVPVDLSNEPKVEVPPMPGETKPETEETEA